MNKLFLIYFSIIYRAVNNKNMTICETVKNTKNRIDNFPFYRTRKVPEKNKFFFSIMLLWFDLFFY